MEANHHSSEKILIYHAYNGILYAPLFLAEEIGLLPSNCELAYGKSDANCIHKLCDESSTAEKCWFAICDPFCEQAHSVPLVRDELQLVGDFITKVPFWLYNTNPRLQRIANIGRLPEKEDMVKTIVSYRSGTTGYLFGDFLRSTCFPKIGSVTTKDFGDEFSEPSEEAIVLTSDLLTVTKEDLDDHEADHGSRRHPIIYDFTDTDRYLFTGLLTKQSVRDEHIDVVVAILKAIQEAIRRFQTDDLNSLVERLYKRFDEQLFRLLPSVKFPDSTEGNAKALLRDSLDRLRRLKIYPDALGPDKKCFATAARRWHDFNKRNNVKSTLRDQSQFLDALPAILADPQRLKSREQPRSGWFSSNTSKLTHLDLIVLFHPATLWVVTILLYFDYAAKAFHPSKPSAIACTFGTIVLLIAQHIHVRYLMSMNDLASAVNWMMTYWIGITTIALYTLSAI